MSWEDESMFKLSIAVVIAVTLSCCAVLAQSSVDTSTYPTGTYQVSAGTTVPVRVIACPEWAMKSWADGIMDGNIHGRAVSGGLSNDLAPMAPAMRCESWAMAVAAAKQAIHDNVWWLVLVLALLLIAFICIYGLRRRVGELEDNSAEDQTRLNELESRFGDLRQLLEALANRPVNVNIVGPLAIASATGGHGGLGGDAHSTAEGGTGGTANLASGEGSFAGRLHSEETTTYDGRETAAPFCTTYEAPEVNMPATPVEDKTLYYRMPLGVDFEEVISRVLDSDGNPDAERPEGWTLFQIRLETRLVNMYPMEVPVAYYGKPVSETPASDALDEDVSVAPGTDGGGNPV